MSAQFKFIVTDTFLIGGRGLILSPFFPVDKYHFDGQEHVRIEIPGGGFFEADADVEIPYVTPRPEVLKAMFVIRAAQKDDVPLGSTVTLANKSAEQVASPNCGPTSDKDSSGVGKGPQSVS